MKPELYSIPTLSGVIGLKSSCGLSLIRTSSMQRGYRHSPKLADPEEWPQSLKETAVRYCIYLPICCQLSFLKQFSSAYPSCFILSYPNFRSETFLSHFSCLLLLNPSFFALAVFSPHFSLLHHIGSTLLHLPKHSGNCSLQPQKMTFPTNMYCDRKRSFSRGRITQWHSEVEQSLLYAVIAAVGWKQKNKIRILSRTG